MPLPARDAVLFAPEEVRPWRDGTGVGDADLQGVSDPPIGPGGADVGGVGLEQDAGVGQLLGGGLAGGDEVVQGLTFLS